MNRSRQSSLIKGTQRVHVVQASCGQFGARNGVGLAEQFQTLAGDLANDANSQAGAGERLAANDFGRQAQLGATAKGGVCRLALTDLDRQARDLFVRWCEEAGCTVTVDGIGNIFARRAGRQPDLPPVMTGSHIDTQPTGGKFDGCYGVMAGLEVIRTLNDLQLTTEAPIEVVVWTNEEGSRFPPCMMGSGVFAGKFDHALAGLSEVPVERPVSTLPQARTQQQRHRQYW